MSLIPDRPPHGEEGALSADTLLETGLAALKQSDYMGAITHLESACSSNLSQKSMLRAQMGLVVAYERTGDISRAIALCQTLAQSEQPKVQQWASKTQADFTKRYPQNVTGFVAFNPPEGERERERGGERERETTESPISNPQPLVLNPLPLVEIHIASEASEVSSPQPQQPVPHHESTWRQAGRAENWRPLKPIKLARLWLMQVGSAIALFWVIRAIVQFGMTTTNEILIKLPFGRPIPAFYSDPTQLLLIVLAILFVASPWLLDKLLQLFYNLKPLPLSQLASQSPESAKVVQRFCRQRRLPLPTLGILPTSAPIAITYGNLPRTARIAVSQGLLDRLADDEIATIYASQLGHIVNGDFIFMSLVIAVLQLPYMAYWQVSEWGDRLKAEADEAKVKKKQFYFYIFTFTYALAAIVAFISYGIYWLVRWPVLWFSRARIYYSDRMAAEITGNPNGFIRALLKIAIGISDDVQKYRATSWLLESFDLLMPLGHQQAISLGSCYHHTPFEPVLKWDCTNSYRQWLVVNYAHPLTGDRLRIVSRLAQFWQLETELDLAAFTQPSEQRKKPVNFFVSLFTFAFQKGLPILQSAILSSLVVGLGLRGFLWLIGVVGDRLFLWQLAWLYKDSSLLMGCLLIGFSISIFMHINAYFPDIKPATIQTEPNLPNIYTNPDAAPPDSQPVSFSGKLLGRRGISNWLGQDLILLSTTGLIKLNFISRLGPLGNLWPQPTRPSDLMDRQVTVTGWFRRGVAPWIDLETLSTQGGKIGRAAYPVWLTILACISALWGSYVIWQGSA